VLLLFQVMAVAALANWDEPAFVQVVWRADQPGALAFGGTVI